MFITLCAPLRAVCLRGKISINKMICPQCNSENRENAKFCDECGYRLNSDASTAALPPLFGGNKGDSIDSEKKQKQTQKAKAAEPEVEIEVEAKPAVHSDVKSEIEEDTAVFDSVNAEAKSEAKPEPETKTDAAAKTKPETKTDPETQDGVKTEAFTSRVKNISAPANRAEEKQRAREEKKRIREMKKQDRKKRRDLQMNSKSKTKIIVPAVIAGVVLAAAIFGVAGYSAELWGGKTVPITAGMSEADAVYTLQQAGFEPRVSKVKSDDTEGIVLMTDPKVGTRVAAGSEVVVHVAESRTIPEVVGMEEQAAIQALRDSGYTNIADVQYNKTNEATEGQVISVDPAADTKAKSSRTVTLTVAQNYRVPDVRGMSEADATYTLREAGYYVYLNSVESEYLQEGTVYSSEPAANTVLDKDKYVTIYVVLHRSSKLESLARDYLSQSSTVQIGGVSYTIDSVQSVSYGSNGVVNFTIMGSPTTSFLGESIKLSSRSVSGAITFSDSNEVIGVG